MERERLLALLEANHTYPGDHRLQVILRQDEALERAVLVALARVVGVADLEGRTVRVPSRKGTYISLRVDVPVREPADVLSLYEALGRIEGLLSYF